MITACFVLLTCLSRFDYRDTWSCSINLQKISSVHKSKTGASLYDSNNRYTEVSQSVEEVVKKFKQECGR